MLRATIWLSVIAWAASEVLRRAGADRRAAARALYAAGALLLALHTIAAFEIAHGWSHASAYTETARQTFAMTGIASGAGLYLNYLFIAVWMADAAWWGFSPRAFAARPRALDAGLFLFFAFMFVNGAVVFATGPMRIAGAAAVAAAIAARLAAPRRRLLGDRA